MTDTPNPCQCCGEEITSIAHMTKPTYPQGVVWCHGCWEDHAVGRLLGEEVPCTRATTTNTVESVDLVSGAVTTITPEGGTTAYPPTRARVVWAGPGETPAYLRPATDPHEERE